MFKHLLLPMDDSPSSESAARSGVRLALQMNAKITALHVESRTRPNGSVELPAVPDSNLLGYARRVAHAAGVDCDVLCVPGDHPYEAIVDNARRLGCDLIVMASHRRTAIEALLFGSQTQHVIAGCNLPVLVVS